MSSTAESYAEARDRAETIVTRASDRRAGAAARVAPLPPIDFEFDPGEHTVNEVLAHVDANPEDHERVLASEKAGKDRSTIVDHLEGG